MLYMRSRCTARNVVIVKEWAPLLPISCATILQRSVIPYFYTLDPSLQQTSQADIKNFERTINPPSPPWETLILTTNSGRILYSFESTTPTLCIPFLAPGFPGCWKTFMSKNVWSNSCSRMSTPTWFVPSCPGCCLQKRTLRAHHLHLRNHFVACLCSAFGFVFIPPRPLSFHPSSSLPSSPSSPFSFLSIT